MATGNLFANCWQRLKGYQKNSNENENEMTENVTYNYKTASLLSEKRESQNEEENIKCSTKKKLIIGGAIIGGVFAVTIIVSCAVIYSPTAAIGGAAATAGAGVLAKKNTSSAEPNIKFNNLTNTQFFPNVNKELNTEIENTTTTVQTAISNETWKYNHWWVENHDSHNHTRLDHFGK